MKEDYLWDKTGEDAEIARLENALQAFRYTETRRPNFPKKFSRSSRKRRADFSFRFCICRICVIRYHFFGRLASIQSN